MRSCPLAVSTLTVVDPGDPGIAFLISKGCISGLACAAGECVDPALAAQTWQLDSQTLPAGYVVNAATNPPLCLNVEGCTTAMIYDGCLHTGGTCAGPNNYSIFQFRLTASRQLASAFGNDQCVEASTAGTLHLAKCSPGQTAAQTWSITFANQLRNGVSPGGSCLAVPSVVPPPPPSPPPPPPAPLVEYTLQLAPRSPTLDEACPPGAPCEYDGINQLFDADRVPKAGSDFATGGNCSPYVPAAWCPFSSVPSPRAPFGNLGNRTYTTTMPAMVAATGESYAKVGDTLTYSGRDWFTYVSVQQSRVRSCSLNWHDGLFPPS